MTDLMLRLLAYSDDWELLTLELVCSITFKLDWRDIKFIKERVN